MREAQAAAQAASKLLAISESARNVALQNIANAIRASSEQILAANQQDIEQAHRTGLSHAMIDRLTLTPSRLSDMADSVDAIAHQEAVVGIVESSITTDDGLNIAKQRVPIGVLAMIFESRPNVVIDCSALAIKSGNAIILKGGKEAAHSNQALYDVVQTAIEGILPADAIQLLRTRDDVAELLSQGEHIDLVIPRGGHGLVSYVVENAKMPVLAHDKGLCHMFIHHTAKPEFINQMVLNAKAQRPGVCNALETLILDKRLDKAVIISLLSELQQAGVELRLDSACPMIDGATVATDADWSTEYLDLILAVKMVDDTQAACAHINQFGSKHTESILAQDADAIAYFQSHVDASAIMLNASTRFNDGGQFQLGAELGISTTKLHAYGPMGAKEMTICRHLVTGDGHIRK